VSGSCRAFTTQRGTSAATTAVSARSWASFSAVAAVAHPSCEKPTIEIAIAPAAAPQAGLEPKRYFHWLFFSLPRTGRPRTHENGVAATSLHPPDENKADRGPDTRGLSPHDAGCESECFLLAFPGTRFVRMTIVGVEQGNSVPNSSQHLGWK
jgi:hypothetical protein